MTSERRKPEPADAEDAALLALSATGDGVAYERLVNRHQATIFRYLRAALGDVTAAEDPPGDISRGVAQRGPLSRGGLGTGLAAGYRAQLGKAPAAAQGRRA